MEFCEELYHLKGKPEYRAPLTVFIDEAPQFVPQRVMGEMARLVGAVQDMILLGRNAGFGVVLISQRFATLNADVRTQADTIIVHRLPSPLDRKALTEWIEENATIAEQKEVLSSLAKLATGEAWVWSPYFDLFKRSQVRARRTFDSSAAPKAGAPVREPKDLTKVDLEKLKAKLTATIEKAKADDPRELRRQVTELKKQIAATPASTKNVRTSTKNVLTDADRALLVKFVAKLHDVENELLGAQGELLVEHLKSAEESLRRVWHQFEGIHQTERVRFEQLMEGKGFQKILAKLDAFGPLTIAGDTRVSVASPIAGRREDRTSLRALPASHGQQRAGLGGRVRQPPRQDQAGDGSLGKMHRAMLAALAQHPAGLTKKQILVHTGYASSGPVSSAFAELTRLGFVSETMPLRITSEGLAALGPFDPLPLGDELREWLLSGNKLNGMEKALLKAVCDRYPDAVRKGEVLEATGYASSGPVSSAFAKLVAYNYVTTQGPSLLKAAEELFSSP